MPTSDFHDPESQDYRAMNPADLDPDPGAWFGIPAERLAQLVHAEAGDRVLCPRCERPHVLSRTANLLFYTCGQASFLAAVDSLLRPELVLAELNP